jgi:hypothetical protein
LHSSVATNGKVVGVRPVNDDSITYAPVFTFTADDGSAYTVSSNVSSNPPVFEPGQQVKVLYEKGSPTNAKIASFGQLWMFSLIFGISGAAATALGYLLLRYERRRNPQFKLFPFSTPTANTQNVRASLLGGPKVDSFEVPRDRDTGREVDL